ncbi:hypothetical protein J0H58_20315 [bacterium]|nr:hypothetical protein [bacterium]
MPPPPTPRVSVPLRASPDRHPLRFGQGNAKLDAAITTFSLPAGYTCPFARECHSKAHRDTGHIRDGRDTRFRC